MCRDAPLSVAQLTYQQQVHMNCQAPHTSRPGALQRASILCGTPVERRLRAQPTSSSSRSRPSQQLEDALAELPGLSAVLPGRQEEKARVLEALDLLQQQQQYGPATASVDVSRSADATTARPSIDTLPATSPVSPLLLGDWQLVFASNGTVVTRTGLAQVLSDLSRLPGVGLGDIVQSLYLDEQGVLRSSNSAVFGFGLLGSWRVTIAGSWTPAEEAFTGRAAAVGANNSGSLVHSAGVPSPVLVAFNAFQVKPCGWLSWQLPPSMPKVQVPLPQSGTAGAAFWYTPYVDEEWRVGRGATGNVFLFRRSHDK